jgi:hypothetical protein
MSYKEIVIDNALLRCYEDGNIERYYETNRTGYIKGWNKIKQCKGADGYLRTSINDKMYKQHRLIGVAFLGLDLKDTKQMIDHINHDKTDNSISNLRIVDNSMNQFNRLGVKGYATRKNCFDSSIRIDNKNIYLGSFKTEEEARQAYLEAKERFNKI